MSKESPGQLSQTTSKVVCLTLSQSHLTCSHCRLSLDGQTNIQKSACSKGVVEQVRCSYGHQGSSTDTDMTLTGLYILAKEVGVVRDNWHAAGQSVCRAERAWRKQHMLYAQMHCKSRCIMQTMVQATGFMVFGVRSGKTKRTSVSVSPESACLRG